MQSNTENHIEETGCSAIAEALKTNSTLVELVLNGLCNERIQCHPICQNWCLQIIQLVMLGHPKLEKHWESTKVSGHCLFLVCYVVFLFTDSYDSDGYSDSGCEIKADGAAGIANGLKANRTLLRLTIRLCCC